MDLRADRLPEIIAQQNDLLSFFGAQVWLTASRHRYTALLVAALMDTVVAQEHRMKHHCSVPRPIDLSPRVQPLIDTPGHSAYPSGHATEGFAIATILTALRLASAGVPGTALLEEIMLKLTPAAESAATVDPTVLLFRLAARMADNRTVAGVHYPVDSAHGALLGLATASGFIGHCLGGGNEIPVPRFSAKGDSWSGDFTLAKWVADLGYGAKSGWYSGTVHVAAAEEWNVLPALWKAAVAEWT
jgi:membrane-associated phospholipid phosphatase